MNNLTNFVATEDKKRVSIPTEYYDNDLSYDYKHIIKVIIDKLYKK